MINTVNLSQANRVFLQRQQQNTIKPQSEIKVKKKKTGKKLLAAGAIATATLSIAAILIAANKPHKLMEKSENFQKTSDEIIKKANKLHQEASESIDEFLNLFDIGKMDNFSDIVDKNRNTIVKYNLNSEGKLSSIVQTGIEGVKNKTGNFVNDILDNIEIKNTDGTLDLIEIKNKDNLSWVGIIKKGWEKFADGSELATEAFNYDCDKLKSTAKQLIKLTNKSGTAKYVYGYNNDKLVNVLEKTKLSKNGSTKVKKIFSYHSDKLKSVQIGYKSFANGEEKFREFFKYIDGCLKKIK